MLNLNQNDQNLDIFNSTNKFEIGKMSVPNVAIGAINKVSKLFYENEFGLPTDGRMGLMLFNESGSGENKIPSAMFGLVASAKLPVITIRQNP